ncbi:hypothetical protein HXA31_04445 [Salipaludibacillus agaradhaerens]|uniref:Uncharacterized protein n=1 Tax=Salipaludibacillus agaradhaerens TaxID=76935 RepID=A0A9Q4B2K7_SALAG|nr:hypothetical protein [Salipaludibacillus agaradhaerens]MCR6096837.1 hypothetical protein [Salipaludibacillus agaradhaerens]MCR6113604.1 hypothetical protein [Salipaludibacillus agaradhaerens]
MWWLLSFANVLIDSTTNQWEKNKIYLSGIKDANILIVGSSYIGRDTS